MKRLISFVCIIIMMLSSLSVPAMADAFPAPVIHVTMYLLPGNFDSEPEIDPDRNRKPSHPLQCTISRDNGIEVAGYASKFLSHEIWDVEGIVCMGDYSTESDFVDALFSMTGEYQIRLITEDYELIGYTREV